MRSTSATVGTRGPDRTLLLDPARQWEAWASLPTPRRGSTMVLVASSGGHLTQLRLIADRIPTNGERRVWVTYDHVSARSSLSGREVVAGYGPSTRSFKNALRNAVLARELYDDLNPDVVLSTGAGIAVPFLLLAVNRGIDAHYVESATRTDGPSLSGRILERATRRVNLHTQYSTWADRRWEHSGNVFDGFEAVRSSDGGDAGLRILVTVGSRADFPYPALIEHVSRLVRPEDEVVWQIGSTPRPLVRGGHEVTDFIPFERMGALLADVDVVVSHAGVGISLSTLMAGRLPVIVPRRAARGEVIDDHQLFLGSELDRRGLAIVREVGELRRDDLEEASRWIVKRRSGSHVEVHETIAGREGLLGGGGGVAR